MFFVSKILTTAPDKFSIPLQEKIYQSLQELQIPFWRVYTDDAVTMEKKGNLINTFNALLEMGKSVGTLISGKCTQ